MRHTSQAGGQELVWKRPSILTREYELRGGDEVLATLRWPRSLGSLAEAEAAEGRWTFKRTGFWKPRATIRRAGSEEDLATFRPEWTGNGVLELAGGSPPRRWTATNSLRSRYAWEDDAGEPLVRLHSRGLKTEAAVEVEPDALRLPELSLLLLFGLYLVMSEQNDADGTSAAVGTYSG